MLCPNPICGHPLVEHTSDGCQFYKCRCRNYPLHWERSPVREWLFDALLARAEMSLKAALSPAVDTISSSMPASRIELPQPPAPPVASPTLPAPAPE